MADLPVKWFDDRFHGIPPMNGIPGAMTNLLDAILINGFGAVNVVTMTVSNKEATLVLEEGVTFFRKAVVALTGLTNQGLNTEYRVIQSSIGTLTIEIDLPDGPVLDTGVVVKYAPLGWIKPFSSVSKAIYKPSKVDALNWMFHVDDTAALYSLVALCEGAESIDSLINRRPIQDLRYWFKSREANTLARTFSFIGDPYCLYYKMNSVTNSNQDQDRNWGCHYFVGEGVRLNNFIDPFAVYLVARFQAPVLGSLSTYYSGNSGLFSSYSSKLALRPVSGIKSDSLTTPNFRSLKNWSGFNNANFTTNDQINYLFTDNFFSGPDNRITKIPGIVTSNAYKTYDNFSFIIDAKDNSLKKDLLFSCSTDSDGTNSVNNVFFYFDITGPWR